MPPRAANIRIAPPIRSQSIHARAWQYPANPAETPTPHVASPSLLSYGVRNRPNQSALVLSGPLTSVTVRYSPHLSASVRIGLCLSPALVPRIATPAQAPSVFAGTSRNSVAFPNRHCDIRTPHMMMSISKSLPRNFGENPERCPAGRRHWSTNSYPRSN